MPILTYERMNMGQKSSISIRSTTQANLHRAAKATSITACIWVIPQYNTVMTLIDDRKLRDLANTVNLSCNIVQKLNDFGDYSNKNR